ncbi:MAG: VC0807 family protein [Acidobacteriaceae bacterium]
MGLSRKAAVNTGVEILVNFVLPYLIYVQAEAKIGAAHALMAASIPPILWSVVEFARKRRIDALSLLVIAGIVLSLLAFLGGGSVRFLQLRENLVTGLIGLAFLGSAAIGRPLIYQLARASKLRESRSEADKFEELRKFQSFRRGMTVMTLVWGFGLLAQTLLACLLVFHMTIRNYLIASPFLGYGTMGALALWTFLYVRKMKRRGAAARAAAEAKESTDRIPT